MSTPQLPTNPALACILARRSVSMLHEPGPSSAQVELLLQAAHTVPDHGELHPYRFVLVQGQGRHRFGQALAQSALEQNPALSEGLQQKLYAKAMAAPAQILLIAAPRAGMKIPEWEQLATAACTGYAITLAAFALGLGAVWKSAPILDGHALRDTLALGSGEQLLGWVNLGSIGVPPAPRPLRTELRASELGADGLVPWAPSPLSPTRTRSD